MIFTGLLSEAWISIGSSRLRTFLAVLGIVIGVGSVVLMLAVGTGSQRAIEESIRKLGSNLLIITPSGQSNSKGVINADLSELNVGDVNMIATLPTVIAAAPLTTQQSEQISSGKNNWSARVTGTTSDFFPIREWEFSEGRDFTDDEMRLGKRVVVVGATIVDKLFPGVSALGAMVRIKNMPFTIVGVLAPKGQDFGGRDQDDVVYIPLNTAKSKLFGAHYSPGLVQSIYVKVIDRRYIDIASEQVTDLLRARKRLRDNMPDTFYIRNLTALAQTATDTSRALNMLLGAIASISLIVGGIGIMNIMLVTVTERTREIGIRKAIGANKSDILLQFLFEAILIAATGSLAGLIIGYGGGMAAEKWMGMQVAFSLWSVVLALAVAVGVGLLSGIYPALKAARLQPIEALRSVGA